MFRRRDVVTFRGILALLKPYARGERVWFVVGVGLGICGVVLQVAAPWPVKWIVDSLTGAPTASSGVSQWLAAHGSGGITLMATLFVVIGAAAAAAEYGQVILLNGLGNRVLYRFRADLFAHVLEQPLAFHESREVGELLTRVVYDTSRLRRGLNSLLTRTFKTLVHFVATIAVLLWLDLALSSLFAVGGVMALSTMRRRGERIARAARRQRRREGSLASHVANELMSVRESQTFGAADGRSSRRFEGRNVKSLRQEQKVRRLAAGLSLRVEILLASTVAIALWWGTRGVMGGTLTGGDLVIFFAYAISLRRPFVQFATQTARIGRTRACGERLLKIARRSASIQDLPDAVPAPTLTGKIVLDDVSLKAPSRKRTGRKWLLRHISATLPARRRIAVVGTNGAGKSTLLRLVLRLAEPRRGRILLDDADLRSFTMRSVRDQMSVVFQDSVLSGLTVRDNISLGIPNIAFDAIEEAAAKAQAAEFIERLPQGYDTLVRKGGKLFSGGERQRIAIARAMLRDGRIWLLDEPTAGLDHEGACAVTEALLEATKDRTTLWVTHDPALVSRLDWVVALDRGSITFSGPATQYRATGRLVAQMTNDIALQRGVS